MSQQSLQPQAVAPPPETTPGTPPPHPARPRGVAWLGWIERRGVLDLALAAVLVCQGVLMPVPPCSNQKVNGPGSDSLWGLIVMPLLTWLILGAGGLAPLTRRRTARPADLPAGAGLWLAAYALMAAFWFMILLNSFPSQYWSIWHLARMSPREAGVLALLIPALLAPGWRRLARAVRLAYLKKMRNAECGMRKNTGSADALVRNPRSVSKAGGIAGLSPRRWVKVCLLLALAAAYAWLLADNAIMSDGFGAIQFATSNRFLEPKQYREPGTLLVLQAATHLLRPLGVSAGQAVHFVSFCAALATLALLGWGLRLMGLGRRQRGAGWWLILSSLGLTQMLPGHVELYPQVQLALTACLVCGLAALQGKLSPGWMCVAFALGLAGHLSVVFILPAVLLVLWLWTRRGDGKCGMKNDKDSQSAIRNLQSAIDNPQSAIRNPQSAISNSVFRIPHSAFLPRPRPLPRALAHLFGWGALVHLPLWAWLMLHLPDPTPRGLVQSVLGSLNTGAQGLVEKKMGYYTLSAKFARLFTAENLCKPLQILFYLAGGALLVTLLVLGARATRAWRAAGRPAPDYGRQMAVLGVAFAGYLLYAFTWPNDWTWYEDWDLFSGIAPLAVLLVARWLLPAWGSWRLPPALVRRLCYFALLLSLTQHYFNHTYAGYLDAIGKIHQTRGDGLLIQRYQLEHGWKRYHLYRIENGKVVESTLADHNDAEPEQ